MKKILFSLFLLPVFFGEISSQVGVSGLVGTFQADEWYSYSDSGNAGNTKGYSIAVDYWFRLKKKRIEFMPELSYGKYDLEVETAMIEHRLFSLFFNTNFYLLDFKNDCNCPTWSNTGNLFTKGFFIQISPGISRLENRQSKSLTMKDNDFAWAIGGGAGVDIGLSDFLTVTPFFKIHYYPSTVWKNLSNSMDKKNDVESNIRTMGAGLRIGLRTKKSR